MPALSHRPPPLGPALHQAITELREELGQPGASITVLGDRRDDSPAARHALSEAGPWVRVTFEHVRALRLRLARPALVRAGLAPEPAGWTAAVIAAALRDAEGLGPACGVMSAAGWGPALRSAVRRLEEADVTSEALRTLPAANDRDLLRLLAGLLATLARARSDAGFAAPAVVQRHGIAAAAPEAAGVVWLGSTPPTDPVVARWCEGRALRLVERSADPPSDAVDLLRTLASLGPSAGRAEWYALLRHPALDPGPAAHTLGSWRGLLARCAEGSAGPLVLDLLAAAPSGSKAEQQATSDLVSTLRNLDEDARVLLRSGRLDEHAGAWAGLLRRWARCSPDRDAILDHLEDIATGQSGPRLGPDLAADLLVELLTASPCCDRSLLSDQLTQLIERGCGTSLAALGPLRPRPEFVPPPPHTLAELGGDPVGRPQLRLRRDGGRLLAGERSVDLRPTAGFVSTELVPSPTFEGAPPAALIEAPGSYFLDRVLGASRPPALPAPTTTEPPRTSRVDPELALARVRAGWYAGGWGDAALEHDPDPGSLDAAALAAWELPG